MGMKAMDTNKISGSFGLLFALFTIKESLGIGVGALRTPGPGLFPLAGGILLAVLSAIILLRAFFEQGEKAATTTEKENENTRFVVYAFLGILAYALILQWLGFLLSTFFLVIFFLKIFEDKKWWVMLLTAAIVSSTCYILFDYILQSDLPLGILEYLF